MDNRLGALALKMDEENEREEELVVDVCLEGLEEEESSAPDVVGDYDLPSQFFRNVGATAMLSRDDEQAIARGIVRSRNRIRRLLRRFPRLTAAALPLHGRSVVHPADDFRERETVVVLDFARQQLRSRRRKVGREAQRLQTANDGEVDRDALAEASGVDADRLETMTQNFQCLSLDSPLGADDDRTLEELLASDSDDPEREAAAVDLSQQLEAALAQLPAREADILRLRFGTTDSQSLTLEEVGRRYGVSRERIRQLEARALRQLLRICERQALRAYVD